jgi:hypothetical protein
MKKKDDVRTAVKALRLFNGPSKSPITPTTIAINSKTQQSMRAIPTQYLIGGKPCPVVISAAARASRISIAAAATIEIASAARLNLPLSVKSTFSCGFPIL